MSKSDQPLLSAKFPDPYNPDFSLIRFPVLASPKIDGFRCRMHPELGGISRTYKPFPNLHTQDVLMNFMDVLKYLDGEITIGEPTHNPSLCNDTASGLMSRSGNPTFHFYVFDNWHNPDLPFNQRLHIANQQVLKAREMGFSQISLLEQIWIESDVKLKEYEEHIIGAGYEGIMIRDPYGRYKNGRSTLKEGILIKVKRFEDTEAVATGFEALERNQNTPTVDAYGHQKRSSHQAGRIQDDLLGVLIGNHPTYGEVRVGSGFDESMRRDIWANRGSYLGQQFTFSFQPHGTRDKPRVPIFKAWRPKGT